MQDLERHFAIELPIASPIHRAHSAAPQRTQQLVLGSSEVGERDHLTKPADQGVAGTVSKSMAADFSFRLGVRWRLSETALR